MYFAVSVQSTISAISIFRAPQLHSGGRWTYVLKDFFYMKFNFEQHLFEAFFWCVFLAVLSPFKYNRPIFQWRHNMSSVALQVKCVFFQNVNNLFNTEFPVRKITITTTSSMSSGLRPQIPPVLPRYRLYYNNSPSYSSSIYSIEEYNTLKWRSESIVYGNSVHKRKKISVLKIFAEMCDLIFLFWEVTCKNNTSLFSTKQASCVVPSNTRCDIIGNQSVEK